MIFFFNDTATTEIYTLSLHDALPIYVWGGRAAGGVRRDARGASRSPHRGRPRSALPSRQRRSHRSRRQPRTSAHRSAAESGRPSACALAVGLEPRPEAHGPALVHGRVLPDAYRVVGGTVAGLWFGGRCDRRIPRRNG